MTPPPDAAAVLRALLGPGRPELGCDACFDELDRYVEAELAGADAEAAVPGMGAHLEGCPACREDHQSLRALLRAGGSPSRWSRPRASTAPAPRLRPGAAG